MDLKDELTEILKKLADVRVALNLMSDEHKNELTTWLSCWRHVNTTYFIDKILDIETLLEHVKENL